MKDVLHRYVMTLIAVHALISFVLTWFYALLLAEFIDRNIYFYVVWEYVVMSLYNFFFSVYILQFQ